MEELIRGLDDATAVRVLRAFAQARVRRGGVETELTPGMREALAEEFAVGPAAGVSEGELARQALLVLAEDPQQREAVQSLILNPPAERFGLETIAVVTAALVVLQLRVKFERKESGRWTLRVEKPTMSDALLRGLIEKLFGALPPGPGKSG